MCIIPLGNTHPLFFLLPPFSLSLSHATVLLGNHALQLVLRLSSERGVAAAEIPVVEVSVSLDDLRGEVDGVAAKEQVVGWADGQRVAHKRCRVERQGARHAAGDAVGEGGDVLARVKGVDLWREEVKSFG